MKSQYDYTVLDAESTESAESRLDVSVVSVVSVGEGGSDLYDK